MPKSKVQTQLEMSQYIEIIAIYWR